MNSLKILRDIVNENNLEWHNTLEQAFKKIAESTYSCPKCKGKGKIYTLKELGLE